MIAFKLFTLLLLLLFLNLRVLATGISVENKPQKIIFSASKTSHEMHKNKTSMDNTFNLSEPIYANISLNTSLGGIFLKDNIDHKLIIMYDLYIDGIQIKHKKSFGLYRNIPENKLTYFTEEMAPTRGLGQLLSWTHFLLPVEIQDYSLKGNNQSAARAFALALLEQQAGLKHIQLNVYLREMLTGTESAILATGNFSLNLLPQDKKYLAFKYTSGLPLDQWQSKEKPMVLRKVTDAYESEFNEKPLMVGLNGSDWQQGRYKLNSQIYKKLSSWAVFASQGQHGNLPITTVNWVSLYKKGKWMPLKRDGDCQGCVVNYIDERGVYAYLKARKGLSQQILVNTFSLSNN